MYVCTGGDLEPDMAEVAAYLVLLEVDSPFTQWVLTEGWETTGHLRADEC